MTNKRGFGGMSPEKRREIAAKGGRSIPAHKRSFSRDAELASRAGRIGGSKRGKNRKAKQEA